MVRFVFSVEDLARTRFAISPIGELTHSLLAWRDPSHAALHVPWLRSLSGRLDGLELERAVLLRPERGYSPDFLAPPPAGPLGSIADDLAFLRATPVARIRDEIELFQSQHPRADVRAWLEHPRRELLVVLQLHRRLADPRLFDELAERAQQVDSGTTKWCGREDGGSVGHWSRNLLDSAATKARSDG